MTCPVCSWQTSDKVAEEMKITHERQMGNHLGYHILRGEITAESEE